MKIIPKLKIVSQNLRKSNPKIILTKKPESKESIIYAITKKLKNNPCKIASVKYSKDNHVDLLLINNLKIKNKRGKYVINTAKEKIDPETVSLNKIQKYFNSNNYEIISEPRLLLIINENAILTYAISDHLGLEYSEESIRKFISKEIKQFKLSQQAQANLKLVK